MYSVKVTSHNPKKCPKSGFVGLLGQKVSKIRLCQAFGCQKKVCKVTNIEDIDHSSNMRRKLVFSVYILLAAGAEKKFFRPFFAHCRGRKIGFLGHFFARRRRQKIGFFEQINKILAQNEFH